MKFYADIVEVVDADTVHVNIHTGLDVDVQMTCRLWGVEAIPMTSKLSLVGMLGDGQCKVFPVRNERETYGRFDVRIWSPGQEDDPHTATGALVFVNKELAELPGYQITDPLVTTYEYVP